MKMAPRAGLPGANVSNSLASQTGLKGEAGTKGVSGALSNLPAFPIIIAEWDRNKREVIRVALDQYNGQCTVNVRVWYRDALKPSRTGITLSVKHLAPLATALSLALDAAQNAGLIDDGGVQ